MSQQAHLRVRPGEVRGPSSEISELDKRIIEHLQLDGRRPFTQIATALGVSEATVRAHTNRLIARGILQIVGVTDPLKLGFQQQAMIGVRCEASQLLEAAEVINAFPEVDHLVVTAGSYDLLVEVVCEDNEALLHFLADKLRRVAGVRETETFVYLRMLKPVYTWGTRWRFALGCGIGPAPRVAPAGSVPASRIASTTGNGRPLRSPIQSLQDRCQRVERRERDRVHHQLDVRD